MRTFDGQFGASRIVFGSGTIAAVADELSRLSASRPLVLSTPRQEGLARVVVEAAGSAGVFTGAAMHTPVEVTDAALRLLTQSGADSVVSIGGGSTTGLGKALASRAGIPHLVVPTTYAGSEVTPVLGETRDGEKTTRSAPEILPDAVIYDVDLTRTLPWHITLTSAVNAMAHAVEALYSADRTAQTDTMAVESIVALASGLRALRTSADRTSTDRASAGSGSADSDDARADLLYGAWLAGRCLGAVGMGLHHKLCHTLGGSFGLPHAPTHTVVLPHAMSYNAVAAPEAMSAVASALAVDDGPRGLQALVVELGGPTDLASLGFSEGDVARAAELATARPYPNPRRVTRDGVAGLLAAAIDGALV